MIWGGFQKHRAYISCIGRPVRAGVFETPPELTLISIADRITADHPYRISQLIIGVHRLT